jgi:sulfite exporter TauE/SafE
MGSGLLKQTGKIMLLLFTKNKKYLFLRLMNTATWFSAFLLGLLGSFHCAGMCGPIALMLPKKEGTKNKILFGRFLYNAGRIVTYITLGCIFGLIGFSVAVQGYQQELSVITGVAILVAVILTSGKKQRLAAYTTATGFTGMLRAKFKKLFSKGSRISLFFIGVLNGMLPCGFVYLAAAGAASTGSYAGGMLYMLLFGLGTFPVMMFISVAANYLGLRFKRIFAKASPLIAIALALFLIYRGTDMKINDCHQSKSVSTVVKIPCKVMTE